MTTEQELILIAAALGVLFYLKKKATDAAAAAVDWTKQAAQTTWEASNTTAQAVVFPIGDALGIPRTNLTACEQAKADGRTWDASFACPAADFIKYLGQ